MMGLMQHMPLTTGAIIDHAAQNHARREVVARRADGTLQRSNWAEVADCARRFAAVLADLGAKPGDRIATLAWNRLPHLEIYYGITASGHVLHTLNPRLFREQIRYVLDHGGASILCVDPDLLPMAEEVLDGREEAVHIIVLCSAADMPVSSRTDLLAYEELLASAQPLTQWPQLDENSAAGLCYTSGTTGNPKGVLYSHRSTTLHALSLSSADTMALSAKDAILLVPPMFHVNAWGIPFAAAMVGAKLVLPGNALDGASLHALLRDEGISFSLGVPTVWFALLDHVEATTSEKERAALSLTRVLVGGASCPRALVQRFRDLICIEAIPAWGMTETSPMAAIFHPLACHRDLDPDAQLDLRMAAGRALFGVELRIEGPDGEVLPHDGVAVGLLKVRGAWVLNAYFGEPEGSALDSHGWLDTGDIARIDPDGLLYLTDRAKDVIKSGGEWISSIDLENAATAHPAVLEAAVIGVPHPRWQERPLLLLRLHAGQGMEKQDMLDHLAAHVARWWLPDDIVVVDDLPHTGTGKIMKAQLRQHYAGHLAG